MPRWLQITLCLVLFAAVMLALRAGLHATVPALVAWLNGALGQAGSAVLVFGGGAALVVSAVLVNRAERRRRDASARRP